MYRLWCQFFCTKGDETLRKLEQLPTCREGIFVMDTIYNSTTPSKTHTMKESKTNYMKESKTNYMKESKTNYICSYLLDYVEMHVRFMWNCRPELLVFYQGA
ncbi:hypothetical protein LOK49_LG10G02181 [Camellia lanceoleosa]|uniref:Uncharacterized protein n=1 Tax=Camellia lanceoleosa TaxID=1840588 RepID=A0ACC0G7P6_9ERIC|nr:hypothetical protein LOK49_LG10G02181 [Camellia lanceoleosa]